MTMAQLILQMHAKLINACNTTEEEWWSAGDFKALMLEYNRVIKELDELLVTVDNAV